MAQLRLTTVLMAALLPALAVGAPAGDDTLDWIRSVQTQFEKRYDFFGHSTGSDSGNCFATLTDMKRFIEKEKPNLSVEMLYSGARGRGNTFSVTHPTLVIEDKKTGETFVVVTYFGAGFNDIATYSLGVRPPDGKVASFIMDVQDMSVLQWKDTVFVDQVMWSAWEREKLKPGISLCGTCVDVVLPNKDKTELLFTQDGKLYFPQRLEYSTSRGNTRAELRSVALLSPYNAAGSLALNATLGEVGGSTLREAGKVLANISSGNQVTRIQVVQKVSEGLEVGARSYYSANPNEPLAGFTRPFLFAEYEKGDTRIFADQKGDIALQLRRPAGLNDTRLTLGRDASMDSFSWRMEYDRDVGDARLRLGVGQGSPIGSIDLPSELARPTTRLQGGRQFYLSLSGEWRLGRRAAPEPTDGGRPGKPYDSKSYVMKQIEMEDGTKRSVTLTQIKRYDAEGKLVESYWVEGKKRFETQEELEVSLRKVD